MVGVAMVEFSCALDVIVNFLVHPYLLTRALVLKRVQFNNLVFLVR